MLSRMQLRTGSSSKCTSKRHPPTHFKQLQITALHFLPYSHSQFTHTSLQFWAPSPLQSLHAHKLSISSGPKITELDDFMCSCFTEEFTTPHWTICPLNWAILWPWQKALKVAKISEGLKLSNLIKSGMSVNNKVRKKQKWVEYVWKLLKWKSFTCKYLVYKFSKKHTLQSFGILLIKNIHSFKILHEIYFGKS